MTTQAATHSLKSTTGRLMIATTVLGSGVAMLTSSVVSIALPSLASDLGASSADQQWVVNAYLLAVGSLILIGGSLGDRFGRVRIYRLGVAWFAISSVVAAAAPSIEFLIGARFLQGVGGAMLVPGSLAIIEASTTEEDRSRAVGIWSGLTGIAAAIGPPLGGLLVEWSWRWVFLINIPIAVAVYVMGRNVPETRDPAAEDSRLDVGGAILTGLALGAAAYALIQGPADGFSVADWLAVGLAVGAGTGLVAVERRAGQPMVPFELFGNRPFAASNLTTLVVYGGMGLVFFLLAIQLQVTVGWSSLQAGLSLLPVTILLLVLSPQVGTLANHVGPRWLLALGTLLMALGLLLLRWIGPGADFWSDILPGLIVFGVGLSMCVAPVTATALRSVPEDRSGAASGANNAIARTGQLLAVSAVPPLVGLSGDALNVAEQLDPGFDDAMVVAAALVASGGMISAVFLRREDLVGSD